MMAFDVPGPGFAAAEHGHPEGGDRPGRDDQQRRAPERHPCVRAERPRDPERRLGERPAGDPDEVEEVVAIVADEREQHEAVPAELDPEIGERERQSALAERLRQADRHHHRRAHQREQEESHRHVADVEPVGDPGGVDPHPPDREEQHPRLEEAERIGVEDDRVRNLGDREHEDEIEEQFDEADPLLAVRIPAAEEVAFHRRNDWRPTGEKKRAAADGAGRGPSSSSAERASGPDRRPAPSRP